MVWSCHWLLQQTTAKRRMHRDSQPSALSCLSTLCRPPQGLPPYPHPSAGRPPAAAYPPMAHGPLGSMPPRPGMAPPQPQHLPGWAPVLSSACQQGLHPGMLHMSEEESSQCSQPGLVHVPIQPPVHVPAAAARCCSDPRSPAACVAHSMNPTSLTTMPNTAARRHPALQPPRPFLDTIVIPVQAHPLCDPP